MRNVLVNFSKKAINNIRSVMGPGADLETFESIDELNNSLQHGGSYDKAMLWHTFPEDEDIQARARYSEELELLARLLQTSNEPPEVWVLEKTREACAYDFERLSSVSDLAIIHVASMSSIGPVMQSALGSTISAIKISGTLVGLYGEREYNEDAQEIAEAFDSGEDESGESFVDGDDEFDDGDISFGEGGDESFDEGDGESFDEGDGESFDEGDGESFDEGGESFEEDGDESFDEGDGESFEDDETFDEGDGETFGEDEGFENASDEGFEDAGDEGFEDAGGEDFVDNSTERIEFTEPEPEPIQKTTSPDPIAATRFYSEEEVDEGVDTFDEEEINEGVDVVEPAPVPTMQPEPVGRTLETDFNEYGEDVTTPEISNYGRTVAAEPRPAVTENVAPAPEKKGVFAGIFGKKKSAEPQASARMNTPAAVVEDADSDADMSTAKLSGKSLNVLKSICAKRCCQITVTGERGAGKSTVAVNLGNVLAKHFRVLVVDMDGETRGLSYIHNQIIQNVSPDDTSMRSIFSAGLNSGNKPFVVKNNLAISTLGLNSDTFNTNEVFTVNNVVRAHNQLMKDFDFIIYDMPLDAALDKLTSFITTSYVLYCVEADNYGFMNLLFRLGNLEDSAVAQQLVENAIIVPTKSSGYSYVGNQPVTNTKQALKAVQRIGNELVGGECELDFASMEYSASLPYDHKVQSVVGTNKFYSDSHKGYDEYSKLVVSVFGL